MTKSQQILFEMGIECNELFFEIEDQETYDIYVIPLNSAIERPTYEDFKKAMRDQLIREEAQRRIQKVIGARNQHDAEIKQLNAIKTVLAINTKPEKDRTKDELEYIQRVGLLDQEIQRIVGISNSVDDDDDFSADSYWK